jgi:hypothetical protein
VGMPQSSTSGNFSEHVSGAKLSFAKTSSDPLGATQGPGNGRELSVRPATEFPWLPPVLDRPDSRVISVSGQARPGRSTGRPTMLYYAA